MKIRILYVEDDEIVRKLFEKILTQRGYDVVACSDAEGAIEAYRKRSFPLVMTDWILPRMDGLGLCKAIRSLPGGDQSVIIVVTGRDRPEDLRAVLDAGADDYLPKVLDFDLMRGLLAIRLDIAERRVRDMASLADAHGRLTLLEEQTRTRHSLEGMVGGSEVMQEVFRRLRLAAESDVTVLLTGESGTGKELAAAAIHSLSARKDKPFFAVNCSAIPEPLLESELFGHVKGAFTGAVRDKVGIFQAASGGTLFLDEIGDVTPSIQVKLLRALQSREIRRIGDEHTISTDVRLISATNHDMKQLIASGAIREDFYYRIRVFEIPLPPLRERKTDIPLLADHFIAEFARIRNKRVSGMDENAVRCLTDYLWPGNARELRNAIEYAFVNVTTDRITLDDLPKEISCSKPAYVRLGEGEKESIIAALKDCAGNRTAASKRLRISRVTLWKKMRQYGLEGAK